MKKFLNIRNLLIFIILIIAIIYILLGRSNDVRNSKSYHIFYEFLLHPNIPKISMQLEHKDEQNEISLLYGTDNEVGKEFLFMDINYHSPALEHSNTFHITTKDGIKSGVINHTQKNYAIFDENIGSYSYDTWINHFISLITSSKYYTKGYEIIDGSLTYYEYFKDINSKFYFDNDGNLIYLTCEEINNSFNDDLKNAIYKVTFSYDSVDDSLFNIPEGYHELKEMKE